MVEFSPVFEEEDEPDDDVQQEGDDDARAMLAEIRAAMGLPRLTVVR